MVGVDALNENVMRERITLDKIVSVLNEKYKNSITDIKKINDKQIVIIVDKNTLPKVVLFLLKEANIPEAQLSTVVGIDETPIRGYFSVTYWVSCNAQSGDAWIGIRSYLHPDDLVIESITKEHPGANWYERENRDLLGIVPIGHPDPRRLVLPDDFPEGVYPLRKDYDYKKKEYIKPTYPFKMPKRDTIIVPFGPYHVACDEPFHFRLFVKGEKIIDAEYRGFYNYRGIEKIAENRLTYDQVAFIAERICGICGFTHSTAYCQAVENAAKIDVPERAKYIRTIMLEIERLHSHLLWIGIACHLLGYDTGFMHAWRIREKVMWLAERLTGNRKTYGMNLVGGVRRDILDYRRILVLETLNQLKKEFKQLVEMLTSNKAFIKRCEGVGILPYHKAVAYSTVGPLARASGRKFDVRKDHPYAAYGDIDFKVPVHKEGDVLARALVRIEEVWESIWIIEQALDKLPGGPLRVEKIELEPYAEALGYTEAPRGENVHYVMLGPDNRVYRYRARAATYNNLPVVPEMLKGYTVADAPLIVASIDPCFSCTERVLIIDLNTGKKRMLSSEEFNALSRIRRGN